ncbi:MAG: hypothetical protein KJ970_06085 [Candidatus Eisenbacteria bacterium]|uniref:Uncharacterized protein n=1 Tax=Eiseniibacteriota bacterium TaxID=2212470 RepID=A0A948RVJ5_UNCEI|nr:hypothetical protein [Candidatus Eisenbacteria bacterium]MBU2690479.1 hypothetical protein [Candidatus Eisenbacteria bacterium]
MGDMGNTGKDFSGIKEIFDIIILNGRPAAGKSEVIDYLKKTPVEERIRRFHIGEFEEFDDFPILWERFEDDDIYQRHGKDRLISDTHYFYEGETRPGYVFKDPFFWNFLIEKLNLFYSKRLRDCPRYHDTHTAIFEFARGTQHGGFAEAYKYLADVVLAKANTIYINVDWEESLRKNRRRYNPDKPDSILEHALEDKKIEFLYKESEWAEFSSKDPDFLIVGDRKIPYAVFENMPEKTLDPKRLGPHLEEVCAKLWKARRSL